MLTRAVRALCPAGLLAALAGCPMPAPAPDARPDVVSPSDRPPSDADDALVRFDAADTPLRFDASDAPIFPNEIPPPLDVPLDRPAADVPDATAPDAPTDAGTESAHVHIFIDNACRVSASPAEVNVPAGGTLEVTYHNHSVDYDADVWLSYGGGFLGLAQGAEWHDRFVHCTGPSVYTASADLSIAGGATAACPSFRFKVNCQ